MMEITPPPPPPPPSLLRSPVCPQASLHSGASPLSCLFRNGNKRRSPRLVVTGWEGWWGGGWSGKHQSVVNYCRPGSPLLKRRFSYILPLSASGRWTALALRLEHLHGQGVFSVLVGPDSSSSLEGCGCSGATFVS